jgi:hypothetical protein
MSPEQARGEHDEIDHRADQFSLAAITYRMLTGREPFVGDDTVALLHQVVHDDPRRPSKVAPWLDTAVDAVLGRGMAKRPRHRYPDMREFAAALAEALGPAAPPPPPRAPAAVAAAAVPPTRPDPSVAPAPTRGRTGRQTRRLIRATRRQIRGHGRVSLLLALAAILAFAWFCPATRDATRGAWRGAEGEARRLVEGLRASAR